MADIEALFRYGMCDSTGSVLAVCLCKEDEDSKLDATQLLRHIVTLNAGIFCPSDTHLTTIPRSYPRTHPLWSMCGNNLTPIWHAAKAGYVAVPHWQRFSYAGNFAEVFYVSDAAHIQVFADSREVQQGLDALDLRAIAEDGENEGMAATEA